MYEHVVVLCRGVLGRLLFLETVLLLDALICFVATSLLVQRASSILTTGANPLPCFCSSTGCINCTKHCQPAPVVFRHPSQSHCHSSPPPSCSTLQQQACHSIRHHPVMPGRAPLSANSRPNTTMAAQAQDPDSSTVVSNMREQCDQYSPACGRNVSLRPP